LNCGEKDCPRAKDVKTCSKRPKKTQVNSIQAVTHDLSFVDLEISLPEGSKTVKALVDSGCSYPLFFSQHIIHMLKIPVIPLPTPIDITSAYLQITHQTRPVTFTIQHPDFLTPIPFSGYVFLNLSHDIIIGNNFPVSLVQLLKFRTILLHLLTMAFLHVLMITLTSLLLKLPNFFFQNIVLMILVLSWKKPITSKIKEDIFSIYS
jgi:hypothetical protein